MSKFNRDRCKIKRVWCGNGDIPNDDYSHVGTQAECLKVGFGAGMAIERSKHIEKYSLYHIPYMNERVHDKLEDIGIYTLNDLIYGMKILTAKEKYYFLIEVLTHRNKLNRKLYNSILLFLDDNNVTKLPVCEPV